MLRRSVHGYRPLFLYFLCRGLRNCAGSSDHVVRLEEEGRRDGEAQGLRGLEVDDELELHGLLYGQVGGFGTL